MSTNKFTKKKSAFVTFDEDETKVKEKKTEEILEENKIETINDEDEGDFGIQIEEDGEDEVSEYIIHIINNNKLTGRIRRFWRIRY